MTDERRSSRHPVRPRLAEKACRLDCNTSPGGRPTSLNGQMETEPFIS
jgi:hypothetical protein